MAERRRPLDVRMPCWREAQVLLGPATCGSADRHSPHLEMARRQSEPAHVVDRVVSVRTDDDGVLTGQAGPARAAPDATQAGSLFAPPTPPSGRPAPRNVEPAALQDRAGDSRCSGFRPRNDRAPSPETFTTAICDPTRLLWNHVVLNQVYISLCQHHFVLKWSDPAQTTLSEEESPRHPAPELAVERVARRRHHSRSTPLDVAAFNIRSSFGSNNRQ